MRKIAAVTFDLWDTLIQEAPGGSDKVAGIRIDGIWKLLTAKGMVHTRDEVRSAYAKTGDFLDLTWSKRRDMSLHDQVLFLLTCVDSKLPGKLEREELERIEKVYAEGILRQPPVLLPRAKEALDAVKSRGYRMGLISNTGRTPGSMLRVVMGDMGILDHFDATTFSNEIFVRKPAEGAFRVTLEKLKVAPKAAVHVGDDARSDIAGAKGVGMHALQLVPQGKAGSEKADAYVKSLEHVLDGIERL